VSGAGYPKRLIEVDLPIKRISAHARREKSIRHGHLSTLHLWWARRPLAACRAIICASLWPDPADPSCPEAFVQSARTWMQKWADEHIGALSGESYSRFVKYQKDRTVLSNNEELRHALLDFIADFSNWDNSAKPEYLTTSRALTRAAHESMGGAPGTRPLVVDPFAGGGSVPLEALRVGADAFASDLNPVPVLLNKITLEFLPRYGRRLAEEVAKWGRWVKREAEKELADFYPKDPDGGIPIAYLWARTVKCEGPNCGADVPLVRSLWLSKKANRPAALQLVPERNSKRINFKIITRLRGGWVDQADPQSKVTNPKFDGTMKMGSATCPCCGYTTPVARVRDQLHSRRGGALDARLMCVVLTRPNQVGRFYRLPTDSDLRAVDEARAELVRQEARHKGELSLVPDESLPPKGTLGFRIQNYGVLFWRDVFTPRQALALTTISKLIRKVGGRRPQNLSNEEKAVVQALLGIGLNRLVGRTNALCRWRPQADQEKVETSFSGQTVPMKWDFAEGCPLTGGTAGWDDAFTAIVKFLDASTAIGSHAGTVMQSDATRQVLPDDSADALITDPPYYDAVPYAALSDFFYVWLKRTVPDSLRGMFLERLTPKDAECIVDPASGKDSDYFERVMGQALVEGRRVLSPNGISVVVFAHKSTSGWEAQLQAMTEAGWTVTGSWPIDTEMGTRLRARDSAALASSVHIVCRPRENPDGSMRVEDVGDWRDVLHELPRRIREWMPRLAAEGVVGADAIFACLGPALEIFSRYSRVEKGSGERINLKEYLEQVWAAVAKEAFNMIFDGADATGFQEDARLTAIWFWVLKASVNGNGGYSERNGDEPSEDTDDEIPEAAGKKPSQGYTMEYDAVRKLAQGLGVNLQRLSQPGGIVVIKGNWVTLNSVIQRERHLFGRQLSLLDASEPGNLRRRGERPPIAKLKTVQQRQSHLYDPTPTPEADPNQPFFPGLEMGDNRTVLQRLLENGSTTLDRLHQAMLLFAHSYSSMLRPFLQEAHIATDPQFWLLAQSLSALYPKESQEKRWVDGVLARKKSLGF
jgi:putative DNA methylase